MGHLIIPNREYKYLKKQEIHDMIIQTSEIKQHDMTWLKKILKRCLRRTAVDKVLHNKPFVIPTNPK